MHQAVLRLEDALAGANLAHLKERRDCVVGAIEVEPLVCYFLHKPFALLQLLFHIQRHLLFVFGSIGLNGAIECGAFPWLQDSLEVLLKLRPRHQTIGASRAILLVCGAHRVERRHQHGLFLLTDVLDGVLLANGCL